MVTFIYDIYEDIEYWEEEYETAPEKTKTLTEAKPVAGSRTNYCGIIVLHKCQMDQNTFT